MNNNIKLYISGYVLVYIRINFIIVLKNKKLNK